MEAQLQNETTSAARESNTSRSRRTTQSKFNIRPAERKDMGLIADFVRSSADWYEPIVDEKDMGQHAVDDEWAEENFKRRDFHIGSADGVPIGTISLQYFGKYAYLGYIYLNVEHVGKGYGQKLMCFAAEESARRGMDGMILIAHPEATWAKKAYLKHGFEIIASNREDVLAWQDGALVPYYEEGFELYMYKFEKNAHSAPKEAARG